MRWQEGDGRSPLSTGLLVGVDVVNLGYISSRDPSRSSSVVGNRGNQHRDPKKRVSIGQRNDMLNIGGYMTES